jgi:hypothetical protein
MTEERGLAQATVTTARSELPMLLKYMAGKTLKQMRLVDVTSTSDQQLGN